MSLAAAYAMSIWNRMKRAEILHASGAITGQTRDVDGLCVIGGRIIGAGNPEGRRCRLLVDTGADGLYVSASMFSWTGIPAEGLQSVDTPTGRANLPFGPCQLQLDAGTPWIVACDAYVAPWMPAGVDALMGMAVLQHLRLIVGPGSEFRLEAPA